jgi:hypothetical protein
MPLSVWLSSRARWQLAMMIFGIFHILSLCALALIDHFQWVEPRSLSSLEATFFWAVQASPLEKCMDTMRICLGNLWVVAYMGIISVVSILMSHKGCPGYGRICVMLCIPANILANAFELGSALGMIYELNFTGKGWVYLYSVAPHAWLELSLFSWMWSGALLCGLQGDQHMFKEMFVRTKTVVQICAMMGLVAIVECFFTPMIMASF